MTALDGVLDQAENVRRSRTGYLVSCPCPDHGKGRGDINPSVSVGVGHDGTVLVKCHAGCQTEDVVAAWGLSMADFFEPRNEHTGGGRYASSEKRRTLKLCTLEAYAEIKRLDVEFLREQGISEFYYETRKALRIPYLDADGRELATRFRIAIEGDKKFRWKSGSKPALYGMSRIEEARESGSVVLVEGESDCHTLWFHGVPALGVPGASTWRNEWSASLDGIERVYAVIEPDGGGEKFWQALAASPIRTRLYRMELDGFKDASEMHMDDPERFRERLEKAISKSVAWLDIAESEARERGREAWARCKALASEPHILDRFAEEVRRHGLAGEQRAAMLLYLALNSRHLPAKQLVNVAVRGPSSAGKTYTVEKVMSFFPEDAYHFLTAMSERALVYSEEPLNHRFLVIAEAAGMSTEWANYLIRSLLSEGRLRYETVESTSDGLQPRTIEREGPTGLIVTTTRVRLHGENETRMLAVNVDDSPDHTREILRALASEDEQPHNAGEWHALQRWIAGGETQVTIPYATRLAEMIPTVAVRLRRDFGVVLNLIRSHALLHRATRERDGRGRIIATLEDYALVRQLVAKTISDGLGATVPKIVRETVEKVKELTCHARSATIVEVGRALNLDKSATHRRVKLALDEGFIRNLEERKGRPAQLIVGDPMPDDREVLPRPEELAGSTVLKI